jgi:hypothetical protein
VQLALQRRFADQLGELRKVAGNPSLKSLAKCAPAVLKTSSLSTLLRGEFTRAPRWEVVQAFVDACRTLGADQDGNVPYSLADLSIEQIWRDRYRALVDVLEMGRASTVAGTATRQPLAIPPASTRPAPAMNNTVHATDVAALIVQANSIEGGIHYHHQSMRSVVALPHQAGIVPPRAASFQHRDAASLISGVVDKGDTAVLTSDSQAATNVLSGLGGVGKTQLAVDYADELWTNHQVDLLAWVTAGSRDAILSSYARLAADLTGIEDADTEDGARRLLEWLARTPARWLVVLDDLQHPRDLDDLWPPTTPTGKVVVTTRRRDAALQGYRRRQIAIGVFSDAEALAYVQARLADQRNLLEGAEELARDLGCLPLALAQATAYLLDYGLTCAQYRARLTDRRRQLASVMPDESSLPDQHRRSLVVTWSLSIEHANQLPPRGVAEPLLRLASVLDPNGIPAEVFTAPAVLAMLSEHLGRDVSAEDARDGLRCLHRTSLISLDPSPTWWSIRVHALVQWATRDNIGDELLPYLVRRAADGLHEVWPALERDQFLCQALRANAEALSALGSDHLLKPGGHAVLFKAGSSLGESGLVTEALAYFRRLLATAMQVLGPDHPSTFAVRGNLAYWRGEAGDPVSAAAVFEELLTHQLRVLGPDHPNTLTARNNLAYWHGEAGDAVGAAAAFKELLESVIRVMGPDHPDTLGTRNNLAIWRGRAGDAAGAAAAFKELLESVIRVMGPDHPNTLRTRNNFANMLGEAGDAMGAAAAFKELLAHQLRVLGPSHPSTLTTCHNLAHWRSRLVGENS